jgi:hypothetical protein
MSTASATGAPTMNARNTERRDQSIWLSESSKTRRAEVAKDGTRITDADVGTA